MSEPSPPASKTTESAPSSVDFSTFVMSLGSSVLLHLGLLPGPDGKLQPPMPEVARHTIDVLALLVEKTRGNLNHDEAELLSGLLYDLRLKFIELGRKGPKP